MITCSTPARISRAWLVSRRYRLSGVVTRMSGGWRTRSRRSSAGVSPVRERDRDAGRGLAQARRLVARCRRAAPAGCARRRRSRALSGLTYSDADRAGLLPGGRRARVRDQAVEAPQERGEGLAAAGRGVDQRVAAAGDGRPALGLGRRGGLERRLEPGPDGGPERCERIGQGRDHGTPSIGASPISHKRSISSPSLGASAARIRARNRPNRSIDRCNVLIGGVGALRVRAKNGSARRQRRLAE